MAWDFRDYNDKAWNSIYKREHAAVTRSRIAAPVIVRSQAAPVTVAQAPAKERAYSYDAPKAATTSNGSGCSGSAAPAPTPSTAPAATPAPSTAQKTVTTRSFSYEPGVTYGYFGGSSVRRGSSGGGNSYQNAMRAKGY
jgi:hypothetical protein